MDIKNLKFSAEEIDSLLNKIKNLDLSNIEASANIDLTIGQVETVDSTTEASASIVRNGDSYKLNLSIPKGEKGDKGSNGGTPSFSIGTISTGSTPQVIMTGDFPNYVLNFVLPTSGGGSGSVGKLYSLSIASSSFALNSENGFYEYSFTNPYETTSIVCSLVDNNGDYLLNSINVTDTNVKISLPTPTDVVINIVGANVNETLINNSNSNLTSEQLRLLSVVQTYENEIKDVGIVKTNIDNLTNNKFDEVTLTDSRLNFKANGINKASIALPMVADSSLSTESINPIQNKIVTNALNNVNSQLDTNTKTRIAKDINSSNYKANTQIDVEYYKMRQTQLFSKCIRKLIKGEDVTGIFQGDSLTYGADKYSNDRRPPDSTPAPDGSVNISDRASKTYPEAMQEFLSSMFNGNITIINRGYAGIYAERSMRMWNEKVVADFNAIMIGTNDSRNESCPYVGDIETYIYWVEQIILQNLIWDIPVILLTPPKTKLADDLDIDTFGDGLINLAKKYNIPILDTREVFKGYPSTIYSDVTHFNGIGYPVLGARLTAFMLGCTKNKIVTVNDVLLTRPQVDNCYYKGNAKFANISAPFTPEEYSEGYGIYAKIEGGKLTYSFYANSDNMVVIPIVNVYSNCTFKMSLDFGTEPSQLSLVHTVLGNSNMNKKYNNVYTYTNNTERNKQTSKKEYISNKEIPLLITQKGWHTITIECENCNFFGLEFLHLDSFIEEETSKGYYLGYTHSSYTAHAEDVTETRISLEDLKFHLGNIFYSTMSYYRTPVLEITVTNYYKNVIKYWVMCGRTTEPDEWVFLGQQFKAGRTDLNERTITNVTFDSNTKELIITWGGATTYESNFVISIH